MYVIQKNRVIPSCCGVDEIGIFPFTSPLLCLKEVSNEALRREGALLLVHTKDSRFSRG